MKADASNRWPHLLEQFPNHVSWILKGNPPQPRSLTWPTSEPYLHAPGALNDYAHNFVTAEEYNQAACKRAETTREQSKQAENPILTSPPNTVLPLVGFLITLAISAKFCTSSGLLGVGSSIVLCLCLSSLVAFLISLFHKRYLGRIKESWDMRSIVHTQTLSQLVSSGELIPLNDVALNERPELDMAKYLDHIERELDQGTPDKDRAASIESILEAWVSASTKSAGIIKQLEEIDSILDISEDNSNSEKIQRLRERHTAFVNTLHSTSSKFQNQVTEALSMEADEKAGEYLRSHPSH